MSVQVLSWVLENSKARLGARLVLIAVANHASHEGDNAFPSVTTIAKESLLSERQVHYCLRKLEASGEVLVKRSASQFGTNLYSFPKYRPMGGAKIAPGGVQNPTDGVQNTTDRGAVDCTLTVLNPSEPSKSRPSSSASPSPEGVGLATLLKQRILENNPRARVTEGQAEKWAQLADRMLVTDQRTVEEIRAVIEWAQRDDFWKANTLSMKAVRKQFDRFTLLMKKPMGGKNGNAGCNGKGRGAAVEADRHKYDHRGSTATL